MIRTKIPEQVMSHDRDFDLDRVFFDLNLKGNNKPEEALWTCDNQKDLSDVGWIEWNLCNYGYRPDGSYLRECLYKITPKDKEFKVYEIDKESDLKDILYTTIEDYITMFDYSKLKYLGYDGLHITARGAHLGHSVLNHDIQTMILMNGFDCESTVWFNTDWIDHIECIDHHLLKTFARMGDAFF